MYKWLAEKKEVKFPSTKLGILPSKMRISAMIKEFKQPSVEFTGRMVISFIKMLLSQQRLLLQQFLYNHEVDCHRIIVLLKMRRSQNTFRAFQAHPSKTSA
jgi:hypothetical protein